MFAAVIPAKNEAGTLGEVIVNLPTDILDLIIPVLNGCVDGSLAVLEKINCPSLAPLCFVEPLGIDVPRAVGALAARELGAHGVLFVDGDMHGAGPSMLREIILAVQRRGLDLALTNCYPADMQQHLDPLAACLLEVRKMLNRHLHLLDGIGPATPSHGPHAVSGRLLRMANPTEFAIPPLLLARAARAGLNVGIAAEIPHWLLGSPLRSSLHVQKISHTIIGDCLAALRARNEKPGSRILNGREYVGYHAERRWDLLEAFAAGVITGECF